MVFIYRLLSRAIILVPNASTRCLNLIASLLHLDILVLSRSCGLGGGGGLISSLLEGGGGEFYFCLMKVGYDLILSHISPISKPPPGNYCTLK